MSKSGKSSTISSTMQSTLLPPIHSVSERHSSRLKLETRTVPKVTKQELTKREPTKLEDEQKQQQQQQQPRQNRPPRSKLAAKMLSAGVSAGGRVLDVSRGHLTSNNKTRSTDQLSAAAAAKSTGAQPVLRRWPSHHALHGRPPLRKGAEDITGSKSKTYSSPYQHTTQRLKSTIRAFR
jgi:hypothetical protein